MIFLSLAALATIVSAPAPQGFTRPAATVTASANGAVVHGSLCRRETGTASAPTAVTVEWRTHGANPDMSVAARAELPLNGGGLSGRVIGCSYFSADLPWKLNEGDVIALTAR
jgi:hypothetical protein